MSGKEAFSDSEVNRRQLIQASGAGVAVALAGCTGGGGGDGGGGTTTAGDGGDGGGGGGGGTETQKGGEVHILTDYTSKKWQNRWEKVLAPGFEKKHPAFNVNIEYTGMQGNMMQRLTTLFQSGNPPNSTQSTPDTTTPMHLQGQTIPTTEVVNFLENKYGKVFKRDTLKWDGEFWYVPHGYYAEQTLNFRQDIYDQLGLSVPKTWDDLLSNTRAITNDKDIKPHAFGIAGVKAGKAGTDFEMLYATNDARLLQWKNKQENIAEIWFPEDKAIETLSLMEKLAEHSPDPSSISWGQALSYWAAGRIAQEQMLNAWPAGVAASAGAHDIAKGTNISILPKPKNVTPADRGFVEVDSATLFDAPNKEMAKEFFKYMYASKDKVIKNHAMEPTRFMPVYPGIIDSKQYKNIGLLSKYDGHLYDLNKKIQDDVLPHMNSEPRVKNLQRYYIARFPLLSEMVNQVLIQGRNKKDAYREARGKLEKRFQEVNEKLGISG